MKTQVVAEIGINHDGSKETAARLARQAEQAGASAVKLQLFDAEKLCAIRGDHSALNILLATQLSVQDLEYVRERVRIPVFASVFNTELLDCYAAAGFTQIKIAAREFEHQPELVQMIGADTRFTRVDVSVTPKFLVSEGLGLRLSRLHLPERHVFALHCIPEYPVECLEHWQLRKMKTLALLPALGGIGLSAHFHWRCAFSSYVIAAAMTLGMQILEVHFRGDIGVEDAREGRWSLDASTFRMVTEQVLKSELVIS